MYGRAAVLDWCHIVHVYLMKWPVSVNPDINIRSMHICEQEPEQSKSNPCKHAFLNMCSYAR